MHKYLIRRLLQSVLVLLGVSLFIFLIVRLTGDPVMIFVPPEASIDDIENIRQHLGLDKPLPYQYLIFIRNALKGDFGTSIRWNAPALEIILERFPATLELCLASMLFALALSIPVGILSALKKDTIFDNFGKILGLIGQSMPTFWLGLILIMVFSLKLEAFPTSGRGGVLNLVLPSLTLSAFVTASVMRVTRSSMLDVINSEYIKLLRVKGLPERKVIWIHALKNAGIPITTIIGLQLATILRGAVVTETIFSWPGVGKIAVDAVFSRDFPLVQTAVIFMAIVFVGVNFMVDIIYSYLDPRIRY